MTVETQEHEQLSMLVVKSRFVTVLHYYSTGPGQELNQWLIHSSAAETTLIEHPFPFSSRDHTRVVTHHNGTKTSERQLKRRNVPLFYRYFLDFLRTIRIIRSLQGKYDWYIGNGFFDALAGIILRRLGRVKRVILYTIDYAPGKPGSVYSFLYRTLDRWCCRHVDMIWNLSKRMQPARIEAGLKQGKSAPYLWVPHGTHAHELASLLPECPSPYRVAFMGHVQEKSGVQLFLDIMPGLKERYPELHLDILGGGPYVENLADMAESRGVIDHVTFHGFIEDHRELEKRLMQCGVGVALYNPDDAGFSTLADPGKPKVYLACGLPVIITDVPEVAEEIECSGAGRNIAYNAEELQQALSDIISRHADFRAKALLMGEKYDWDHVFVRAWGETMATR
jgi:glycosyltransferase involved in cell wall biosynthesis